MKPPSQLVISEGNISENFKKWKREMEIYLLASGSSEKSNKVQTNIILHCAGPSIIEIYDQFQWDQDDDKENPEKVFEQLQKFCNPRSNEVLESHRFWTINMESFPSFDTYLTEVRKKAESCNFTDKDRMIRDKIVFNAQGKLQELLLREDKLDLEKCLKICRAYEQSNKHVKEIRQKETVTCNKVDKPSHGHHKQNKPHQKQGTKGEKSDSHCFNNSKTSTKKSKNKSQKKCNFCSGLHEFTKEKCPAWGKTCNACGGRNHFKSC